MSGGAVEVVCVGDTAYLQDLGLNLTRGEKVSLTLLAANRSKDLADAEKRGIVEVNVVKAHTVRAEVPRPPPNDSPNRRTIERSAYHAGTPPTPPETPTVDFSPVLEALAVLTREVRELKDEVGRMSLRTVAVEVGSLKATRRPVTSESDVPVFIPSGIVDQTLTADVNPQSSKTGGVSEAEEALRALRKKKPEKKDG